MKSLGNQVEWKAWKLTLKGALGIELNSDHTKMSILIAVGIHLYQY